MNAGRGPHPDARPAETDEPADRAQPIVVDEADDPVAPEDGAADDLLDRPAADERAARDGALGHALDCLRCGTLALRLVLAAVRDPGVDVLSYRLPGPVAARLKTRTTF